MKLKVFVPSTGFLSIYTTVAVCNDYITFVFVPSTGFLSIYKNKNIMKQCRRFSSPQRGSYLSTTNKWRFQNAEEVVFVPSTGFLSIYLFGTVGIWNGTYVFVPSTGFLSIYRY